MIISLSMNPILDFLFPLLPEILLLNGVAWRKFVSWLNRIWKLCRIKKWHQKFLKEGSCREGEIAEKTQEVKVYWRRILVRNRMN